MKYVKLIYEVREGEKVVFTGTADEIAQHFGESTKRVHQCAYVMRNRGTGTMCGKYTVHDTNYKTKDRIKKAENETQYDTILRILRQHGNYYTSCDPSTIKDRLSEDGIEINYSPREKVRDGSEIKTFYLIEVKKNETRHKCAGVQK